MTTATAPRRDIISIEDRGDTRHVRYRWGDGEEQTSFATEVVRPVSREVLEDRYAGMMGRGNTSKLLERLDRVLWDIAERLTCRDLSGDDYIYADGVIEHLDSVIEIGAIEDYIREWMLERAEKVAIR